MSNILYRWWYSLNLWRNTIEVHKRTVESNELYEDNWDSYFNQVTTKMRVLSTIETEPMIINGKFYRWYPKIRQSDIGKDTSNKFIDTCNIANPYCILMGAGKSAHTIEM